MTTTLEALASSNEFTSFFVYDTISATSSQPLFPFDNAAGGGGGLSSSTAGFVSAMLESFTMAEPGGSWGRPSSSSTTTASVVGQQGRKKRRRKPRSCKNKEEAESQRMTHIAVERNRRRQMNEHLAVLRSLMPESYIQRGDQASIVGGAIDFVKELEQLLQSLEAQKRTLQQQQQQQQRRKLGNSVAAAAGGDDDGTSVEDGDLPPFAQFFAYPQYVWRHGPREYPSSPSSEEGRRSAAAMADIEVTLVETHANLRILSPRRPGQLLKMVAGFQTLQLTILHLNVTTLDPMVLYSFSAKVEEGCNLASVDDIAAAVHHMLSLIEAEAALS